MAEEAPTPIAAEDGGREPLVAEEAPTCYQRSWDGPHAHSRRGWLNAYYREPRQGTPLAARDRDVVPRVMAAAIADHRSLWQIVGFGFSLSSLSN